MSLAQQFSDAGSLIQQLPGWLQDNADRLIAVPLQILLVLLVAVLLRLAARKFIDRTVQRMVDTPRKSARQRKRREDDVAQGQARERRRQRGQTIGSVLRSTATIVIFSVAGVIALGQVGIDIAPIIASAGIVGLAFGFGAQSLVSDFIAGLFMLMEDQYGVGDWVDIDGTGGTVEEVGLRVTKLRDTDGAVWYVRNGIILKVGNYSQDWACALLDVPVRYDQDVDAANRALEQAAWSLWDDEAWRDQVIDSPQIWGITSLAREAVTLRVSVNTVPLQQWAVGRELRARVRDALTREGIQIPRLNQQVLMGPNGEQDASSAPSAAAGQSGVSGT